MRFLKTSLPAALDLATQTLLWTFEAILIGNLKAAALAGYSMAIQIVLVFFAVLLTFIVGAGLIINRHLGARDYREANHILGQALMISIVLALITALVWYSGAIHLFRLINENGSSQAREAGIIFLRTLSFFAPLIMTNFVAVGIIRAVGDTRFSMRINFFINGINVVLSPVLIFGLFGAPRLEVQGAALAAGISHSLGSLLTLYLLRSRKLSIFLSFKELTRPRWQSFKQLFKMGAPTTVEQMSIAIGQLVVMGYAGAVSVDVLTTQAIYMRIQSILSMAYLGFSMAAMAQMGQNLGANDSAEAEKTAHIAHRTMAGFVVIIMLSLIAGSRYFMSIFTQEPQIVDLGRKAIWIFAVAQMPKALNNVLSGNMRGIGMLRWLMMTTILSVIIFEISLNYAGVFLLGWGLVGMWGVQAMDETVRFSINYAWFINGSWRKRKEHGK